MKPSIPVQQPTLSDYDIGSIHWLLARDKIPIEHLYATVQIEPGCFDHPVVILWVNQLKTEAIVLIVRPILFHRTEVSTLTSYRLLPSAEQISHSDIPTTIALAHCTSPSTPAPSTLTAARFYVSRMARSCCGIAMSRLSTNALFTPYCSDLCVVGNARSKTNLFKSY